MTSIHWRPFAISLLIAMALAACGKETASNASPADNASAAHAASADSAALTLTQEEKQATGIRVAPLQEQEVHDQIAVTATIQANQNRLARIAPRVSGKVVKALVNLGDQVKAGQPLALIDSVDAGEAQSAYTQAVAEQALAKAATERADKLYADQIIPQKEYLRARADLDKANAVLRAANAKRHALGLTGRTPPSGQPSVFPVTAPFAGTVIDKKAVIGELAQADTALFSIADLSTVWIDTNLFEKDLGKVTVGAPAQVNVVAYPDQVFKGKVTYISSVMDKETHTAKARIEVPNPDGRLKLDMFATAVIATGGKAKALLLPDYAVVLIQGQPTVFIADKEGFEARAVELGNKLNGQVVLKSGIRPGDTVVVHGAYALKAKMLKSQISAD